ncbi:MAG: hypothetical protein V4617_03285 [Gemmatimonadota bacterium]
MSGGLGKHVARATALSACLTLCLLLPFLPGRHDALAVPLSMMAQLFGIAGLVLVPVGAGWLLYELTSRQKGKRRAFGGAAFAAVTVVWLVVSVGTMFESVALGSLSLLLLAAVARRLWQCFVASERVLTAGPPVYLLVLPAAVGITRVASADAAAEFSRSRAIHNAAPLIADIERHHASNGRYPVSIVSVNPDYLPGTIGIARYQYELNGTSYNVLFEQLSLRIGIREIVMYNPRGEHRISSHAADVIGMTPAELALDRSRGHNAIHAARQPGWRYFWFD